MSLRTRDILFRFGGRTLLRYGTPYWRLAPEDPLLLGPRETFARADSTTCATVIGRDGLIRTAAANIPRFEWVDLDGDGVRESCGYLSEITRANLALYARDMTNAVWTKSNVTAAKDQTGVDGTTNGASSLLATAGNGTCLQSITSSSNTRVTSCWIKRLVGSGEVDLTQDNGSTWTPVTVTTAWTKVRLVAQSLTNPTIGFRLVTNADKIAVDFVQHELGVFETSSIATTSTSVTRASDNLTLPFTFGPQNDVTILYRFARPVWADLAGSLGQYCYPVVFGSTSEPRLEIFFDQNSRIFSARSMASASQASGNIPAGASLVFTSQHKDLTTTPAVAVDMGSGLTAFDTGAAAASAFTSATASVGMYPGIGSHLNAVLVDLIVARGLWPLTDMAALA
jgi:hypothetical protein